MKEDYTTEAELDGENETKSSERKFSFFRWLSKKSDKSSQTTGSQKSFVQKVGIQNLCILFVLGLALIYLYCQGSAFDQKKKSSNKSNSIVRENFDSNSVYGDNESESERYISNLEAKLGKMISKMKGIGEAEVIITLAESKGQVALKDTPYTQDSSNENDGEGGSRESNKITREDETVMSITEEGANLPYIIKETQPVIEGVVVFAQGGTQNGAEVDIVEAIEALFDVPIHKIKVVEMDEAK